MKKEHANLYEGIYILNASLSEEAMKKALERITSAIEERKGEIHKIHEWGRKKLAYQIDGHKQGQYFILYFSVVPSALAEMRVEYQLNEDLIRHMHMRTDAMLEKIEFKPLSEE